MKQLRRSRPRLETLEDRVCPVLSIKDQFSILTITGTSIGGPTGIVVTETLQGKFQVVDNGVNKGTFPASTITMNLTSRRDTPVDFNFGGFSLPGNLTINAGLGVHSNPGTTGVGVGNGTIGGGLLYTGGSGNEDLYLGLDHQGHNTLGGNLRIGGNVLFSPRLGNIQSPKLIVNVLSTAIPAAAGANVTIGGDLIMNNTGGGFLGSGTTIGGNLTISAVSETYNATYEVDGTVGKNLTLTGGAGGTNMFMGAVGPGALIKGSVTANQGSGPDFFDFFPLSVISGSATIQGGPSADLYFFDGTVNGSLTAYTGDGADSFENSGAVAGNLSLYEGNGNNTATMFTGPGVAGNLTIVQGNGNNALVTVTAPVAGLLSYTGGNGTDSLSLLPAAAQLYNVSLTFGTNPAAGSYVLTLNANDTLTGVIKGNGGGNTFNQGGANLLPTLIFINYP